MLRFWRKRRETQARADELAQEALTAALSPVYYRDLGVPDTFDGRFEAAVLELFIRLYNAGDAALSQRAFNAFFRHMDLTLREMGVGDLGVPRHMKRMMSGFNGRLRHYWQAVETGDRTSLIDALTRNVYGTVPAAPAQTVERLADNVYVRLSIPKEKRA